ncbi:MAG: hypothetical protein ABJA87_00700 [bacterium]
MSQPAVIVGEIDRPNIDLATRVVADDDAVTAVVQEEVAGAGDSTVLVYAATRRRVEE